MHEQPLINRTLIAGTILETPDLRLSGLGSPFLILKLAAKLPFRDVLGNHQKKDNYFCVAVQGDLATECKDLTKGISIFIEGRLVSHEWEEEGKAVTSMKVLAETVQIFG